MAEGDTYRATVIMRASAGTQIVFDFGYVDVSSGATHIDMGTAAGDFQTLVQGTLAAALPSTQTFIRYRFACLKTVQAGEVGYVDVDPPVVGDKTVTLVTDVLPLEMCVSMKRNTGHTSRRDRGRVFFGAVCSTFRDSVNVDKIDP